VAISLAQEARSGKRNQFARADRDRSEFGKPRVAPSPFRRRID